MWFDDRQFHAYDIATGKTATISADVPYPLWNETMDFPLKELEPYGVMGWSENGGAVLVYDRYDVWASTPRVSALLCVSPQEKGVKQSPLPRREDRPGFSFVQKRRQDSVFRV